MSSLLTDSLTVQQAWPSDQLRTTMAAMPLSFTWFGVRKSLTAEHKAEAFGAEGDVLSAGHCLPEEDVFCARKEGSVQERPLPR